MKKALFITIFFFALLALFSHDVNAADIFFSSPPQIKLNEKLELVVNLNTDGVPINSIELVVNYDEELFVFNGYSEADSMVKLWIYPPYAEKSLSATSIYAEQKGKLYLSGIIPGGISGLYDAKKEDKINKLEPIPLVHLFFTAIQTGNANFSFESSKILQHDGIGTPLLHSEVSTTVLINNSSGVEEVGKTPQEEILTKNTKFVTSSDGSIVWFIFAFICIFLLYKLLKYKYGK